MPLVYEAVLILRPFPKEQLKDVLKRVATNIFVKDGFIRNIHNIGKQSTPYKIFKKGVTYQEANYFMLEFCTPYNTLAQFVVELNRDPDIVYSRVNKQDSYDIQHSDCKLEDELKPPAYRSEVLDMIEIMKKRTERQERRKVKLNTGLDYYPFQR